MDCDFRLGCLIGCVFCYYRWVEGAAEYFGTGKLKDLCSPEELAEALSASPLVRKDRDPIMLCARGDASFQVGEVSAFLAAFKHRNPVFVLHRGYFGPRQLDAFAGDPRVVFATTLTPRGRELGWTRVDEFRQLEGIGFLLENGVHPRRISVEVGPINEVNAGRAAELLGRLEGLGLEFAVYRGVSVGSFRVLPSEEQLRRVGFLTTQEASAPEGHAYYRIKNVLAAGVEEKIKAAAGRMRLHRFTGTLYRDEFGVSVAYNRNNRWRRELGLFGAADPALIGGFVEQLGFPVEGVEATEEGYLVRLGGGACATEDVAMTAGAEFGTSVLFDRYRIAPTPEDLRFYVERGFVPALPGVGA
ncbi:MAG: hypothetical protein ACPLRW_06820 [Moorellales bacterium]